MINIGIIGYGYWGPNLVRNFVANANASVTAVADCDRLRLAQANRSYPSLRLTQSAEELIRDPTIDAVAIATPVSSHFELALAALTAGKHVLIEKPVTASSAEAARLIEEAERRGLVLLVDHTFVYTGAVRMMRDLVRRPGFGKVRYYDSTRINLGIFQHDVNVLWDLAVHDLSIMGHVMEGDPVAVSATGQKLREGSPEYAAFLTVFFDDAIAHINVNWLSPVKVRRTLVGGANQMIVYDDLETSEKIKLFDKGIETTETVEDKRRLLVSYRTGDMWSPKVNDAEALAVEVEHFIACIARKEQPETGGLAGLQLVRILEAANLSMARRGAPVELVH